MRALLIVISIVALVLPASAIPIAIIGAGAPTIDPKTVTPGDKTAPKKTYDKQLADPWDI